jgi:uncharacterized damage-inducible protein DinB
MLRSHLFEQLRHSHDGDPWHGSSRMALLDGVTASVAARRPIPGAHSIWELVLHMTAWTQEVTRRLRGGEPSMPEIGDWPPVGRPTGARWEKAIVDLADAHRELVREVERLGEERLVAPVGRSREPALGTGQTVNRMLAGIAEHDAYHCGQIALLRKASGKT